MRKFFAVFKREYLKVVKSWTFVFGTLLVPLMSAMFAVVPVLLMSLNSGAVHIALVDQSGQISARVKQNLSAEKIIEKASEAMKDSLKNIDTSQQEKMKNSAQQFGGQFKFEETPTEGKSIETIRQELNELIKQDKLDAYLIIPPNYEAAGSKFEFLARNTSDFITKEMLEDALNDAVRSHRLAEANISEDKLKEINRKISLSVTKVSEKGEEKDAGNGFWTAFVVAFMLYLVLTLYGQAIMAAIIEEKETRIAEILFSSAKPFELFLGKLAGVGMAGLTQLAIWVISALMLTAYGLTMIKTSSITLEIPAISPLVVIYFFVFFLLGFFTYAAVFAILGSIVPSLQEAGQFAVIPVFLMLGGFYGIFPITRDPNSPVSVTLSLVPFISPMAMPTRIVTEMPPWWQVALAILINLATILVLTWVASRVYRIGMLMYGKRATIPEIWRWIWQQ